jgi:CheY-like chemotaxis protein/two-component sensor histidine kinase
MRPYVQTILDSGQSLLRLLTDALDMSRAEAGLMTFETAPIDLDSVATDLKALWSPRAEEKDLILTVTRDTISRDWVAGDEVRLKQLFNNLIGNALKFTEAGEVAVHISSRETDGQIALTATVDDSGPGIPEDLVGSIFEPFNTGHAGREGAGAGLGLAICRQIVERMNGSIAVERSPQGGARFRFALTLPGASPEMQAAAVQMASPTLAATLHVLIVDDNATNRFVAAKVLELFGCDSEAVEGGREAVDHVQTGAFDLILMDIKMPGMDGVQATRLIRGLSGPVARIPILALTANADPVDEVAYLAAGMDGVAQKPIQPDALLNAIHLVMDRASAQTTAVTEAA